MNGDSPDFSRALGLRVDSCTTVVRVSGLLYVCVLWFQSRRKASNKSRYWSLLYLFVCLFYSCPITKVYHPNLSLSLSLSLYLYLSLSLSLSLSLPGSKHQLILSISFLRYHDYYFLQLINPMLNLKAHPVEFPVDLTHGIEYRIALNNATGEFSGFFCDWYFRQNSPARTRQTSHYNTAKLSQRRQKHGSCP